MKSAMAMQRLTQLADPGYFNNIFQKLNFGTKPGEMPSKTSCYINMVAVVKQLTNQQIPSSFFASALTGARTMAVPNGQTGAYTREVMRTLEAPTLIQFGLKFTKEVGGAGDHFFTAFPLDDGSIIASMGWQSLYTFPDWFRENDKGRFRRDNFADIMGRIEGNNSDAVVDLCAYVGQAESGPQGQGIISRVVQGHARPVARVRRDQHLGSS
jgi:hypothetical protein